MSTNDSIGVYGFDRAAEFIGVKPTSLRRAVKAGAIHPVDVFGSKSFRKVDLREWYNGLALQQRDDRNAPTPPARGSCTDASPSAA